MDKLSLSLPPFAMKGLLWQPFARRMFLLACITRRLSNPEITL
jgi:hypothetical protein